MSNPRVVISGGIRVGASGHGRTTPENPTRVFEISIPIREVGSTIECGFQVPWGKIEDVDGRGPLEMGCGAGFGSGWATIKFEDTTYAISGADFVSAFLGALDVGEASDDAAGH